MNDLPPACPCCNASPAQPSRAYARYTCGAIYWLADPGSRIESCWVLPCPRAFELACGLRAETVRLGDRVTLLTTELTAIKDTADWGLLPGNNFVGPMRHCLNDIADFAVEALAEPPVLTGEAPRELVSGQHGLELSPAVHGADPARAS